MNPPSTGIATPVIQVFASEPKYTARLVKSAGLPRPLNGCLLARKVRFWSLSTRNGSSKAVSASKHVSGEAEMGVCDLHPGQMTLTWTRCGARSSAAVLVMALENISPRADSIMTQDTHTAACFDEL